MDIITLKNTYQELKISPSAGGSIFSYKFKVNGKMTNIMRPTSVVDLNEKNVGNFSSFNLIPYSNVLENGILKFNGQSFKLFEKDKSEHRRHGEIRYKPLQVLHYSSSEAILGFNSKKYKDLFWPFSFYVKIIYTIEKNNLYIKIIITNTDNRDMPCGMGIHPYFVRYPGEVKQNTYIKMPVVGVYPGNETPPASWIAKPDALSFRNGNNFPLEKHDKCYKVENSESYILWEKSKIKLTMKSSEEFGHMVLYCPENNSNYFAFEPVTHCNNGFNMNEKGFKNTGRLIVHPQQQITGTICLRTKLI